MKKDDFLKTAERLKLSADELFTAKELDTFQALWFAIRLHTIFLEAQAQRMNWARSLAALTRRGIAKLAGDGDMDAETHNLKVTACIALEYMEAERQKDDKFAQPGVRGALQRVN